MNRKRSQEPAYLILNRLSQCQTDLTRNVRIPASEKSPALTTLAQEQRRHAFNLIGEAAAALAKCMELVEAIDQLEEFNSARTKGRKDFPQAIAGNPGGASVVNIDQGRGTGSIARTGEANASGLEESDARRLESDAPPDRTENEGNLSS